MRKCFFALGLLLSFTYMLQAQRTEIKRYEEGTTRAGDVYLIYSYGERNGNTLSRIYVIDVPVTDKYNINTISNLFDKQKVDVYINNDYYSTMVGTRDGWQYSAVEINDPVYLVKGKYTLRFVSGSTLVPMVDELLITRESMFRDQLPQAARSFLDKVEALKQQPVLSAGDKMNELAGKVLPNPEGEYAHAIDTAFVYSHFSWVYLTAGNHTFTTSGSTISRSLAVFHPTSFSPSSANINGGPGGESQLNIIVSTAGYHAVTLRPVSSGASGTTNINLNGSPLVSGAVIGGKHYFMPQLRGGDMNFFTCKISGDTRIFVSKFTTSSVRGYNDDYSTLGSWSWGLASRIKKNFNGIDSVQAVFVCAYSPTSTGITDIYMGCGNSNLDELEPANFPLLTNDDAIRSAPSTGMYNCISWSGGITNTWIWPPSSLSTYNCTSGTHLTCFDNYYSNNPVRYPGAWNYTRTGATSANSVVDLWKTASAYTHASVKEPGNNHPHGYDWESKPGGTNRTLHPRNALEQPNWYGAVSNYYRHNGTYARNAAEMSFATDVDAVKAGVAIFDVAVLTKEANEKLSTLLRKNSFSTELKFNELYAAWDATKAANSSLSDPSMYCRNKEFKAMETFALANHYPVMLLVFDKFIKGDHFIGDLMLVLTKEKYGKLLDEVKTERLANLYDKEGRYRIHGDHDNGVLYIEKILKGLKEEIVPVPVTSDVNITVSPNPVADRLTVQVVTTKSSMVSVVLVSAQTGMKQVLRPEAQLAAGTYRFETSVKDMAGTSGNMLAVQVTVDGVMKTVKVMLMK